MHNTSKEKLAVEEKGHILQNKNKTMTSYILVPNCKKHQSGEDTDDNKKTKRPREGAVLRSYSMHSNLSDKVLGSGLSASRYDMSAGSTPFGSCLKLHRVCHNFLFFFLLLTLRVTLTNSKQVVPKKKSAQRNSSELYDYTVVWQL